MPNKAKLVTRASSSSTVSTDTIPKSASLTHAELDSNLINLRDATFGVASDDSTVIDIGQGNTLKVAGAGTVSTAVSGQTLTITGASGSITLVGDDSTGTTVSQNETFKIAGAQNITTAVSGDTLTITGSKNIEVNEISSGDSSAIQISDNVNVSGTFNAKTIVTNDLISEDSAAINVVDGLNVAGVTTINNTLAVTSTSTFTGDATFLGSITGDTNGNINLVTNGTGEVNINKVLSAVNYPFTPVSTNFPAFDSGSVRGTTILFSDLAIPNITTDAGKYRVNNRIISAKADSSATTYNNTAFVIQNSDIALFDLNGAPASGITSRGSGIRGSATNTILTNSGGGTKTSPNIFGGSAFTEIVEGHGGDLTVPNVMGHRAVNSIRANTGETTRATNVFGYVADTTLTAGTGAIATRVITNDHGFYAAPATTTNISTNYYGFYVNSGAGATNKYAFYSAEDAYLSRLGTIEGFREKVSALTFSASIAVNTDLAPIFTVTLTGNTDFTLNNLSTGQTVTIIVTQDGTGSRTATFSTDTSTAVKFAAGSATLSTAANAIDVVRIVNTGTNFIGILDKGFA